MKKLELFLMALKVPVDFLMLILAGIVAFYVRSASFVVELRPVLFQLSLTEYLNIVCFVIFGWIFIFALTGLYSVNPNKKLAAELKRVVVASCLGLTAIAFYMLFTLKLFDSRFLILASWFFAIIFVSLGRLFIRGLKSLFYRNDIGLRRVIIIGNDNITTNIKNILNERKELGYKILDEFASFNKETEKKLLQKDIDELLFINPRASEKEALAAINFCNEHQIIFKYSGDIFSIYSTHISVSPLAGVPVIELTKTRLDGWWKIIKRIFDILISVFMLIILIPLFALISLVILIETGRPIIYKNERVGHKGKKFFTYKFRSMYQKYSTGKQFESNKEAEKKELELIKTQNTRTGPIYKIGNDPRITGFGKFLRRFSLDELPQFLNVLKGEMSVVGPRPHQPREVEKYEKKHKKVFYIKPGITGLAQISGRSDLTYEEELNLDIFYIENWNLFLDFIIFIKTPLIILKKRKAL